MDQSYQEQQQQSSSYTEFFSWGNDTYGQLALANSDEYDQHNSQKKQIVYDQPKSLSFDILISSISCGDHHSGFISSDGFVFSVGRNTHGQLGVGDSGLKMSSAPLLVDTLQKPQTYPNIISCGGNHTAVIMDNGELYTWGEGTYGALGQATTQNVFSPIQVQTDNKYCQFVTIDCGRRNMMVIDSQGKLYVSGENAYRQLGVTNKDQINSLTCSDFTEKVISAAIGVEHTLILTQDSRVFACGNNVSGNLGLGHTYSSDNFLQVHGLLGQQIKQIEAGRHSAAITSDGRLYVWGPVFKGEENLLLPQELRSSKLMNKIAIGEKDSILIDEDNQLYSWGLSSLQSQNANAMPTLVEALSSKIITQVAVGFEFFIALGQDFNEFGDPINQKKQQLVYEPPRQEYISSYNKQPETYSNYQPQTSLQKYNSKENLKKPTEYIGKPPIQSNFIENKFHENSAAKREISMISAHSIKDPSFQFSQIQNRIPEFDQSLVSTSNLLQEGPITQPITTKQENSRGVTNAELYKQLDQVKDENHNLKKQNRELIQKNNQLKNENENIINNADSEIKRMSEFIDQYTQEIDATKKDLEDDLNAQISKERKINEELRNKFQQEQNEIDKKLDNLQREIEKLKRENTQISQEKNDLNSKCRQLQDQLTNAQQRISQMSQQRDYSTISPISTQKQVERPHLSNSYSRTSNNNNLSQLNDQQENLTQSRGSEYQAREQQYKQIAYQYQAKREAQTPQLNAQRRRQPADFSPIQGGSHYDQPSATIDARSQVIREREFPTTSSEYKHEKHTPQKISHMIGMKSPMREPISKENLQPADFQRDYTYENRDPKGYTQRTKDDYNNVRYKTKSPIKGNMNDAYEIHPKMQQLQNVQATHFSPNVQKREEQNIIARPLVEKESPALNDVKNRLAAMQKNKEELEQKLRNYEAKIRQHFNR